LRRPQKMAPQLKQEKIMNDITSSSTVDRLKRESTLRLCKKLIKFFEQKGMFVSDQCNEEIKSIAEVLKIRTNKVVEES